MCAAPVAATRTGAAQRPTPRVNSRKLQRRRYLVMLNTLNPWRACLLGMPRCIPVTGWRNRQQCEQGQCADACPQQPSLAAALARRLRDRPAADRNVREGAAHRPRSVALMRTSTATGSQAIALQRVPVKQLCPAPPRPRHQQDGTGAATTGRPQRDSMLGRWPRSPAGTACPVAAWKVQAKFTLVSSSTTRKRPALSRKADVARRDPPLALPYSQANRPVIQERTRGARWASRRQANSAGRLRRRVIGSLILVLQEEGLAHVSSNIKQQSRCRAGWSMEARRGEGKGGMRSSNNR
ncbi:hypothetical protein FQR65_LT20695 [Abscondita terminalis]|nr:hypothetical protein FQR65_LT20695 [Abscondita terminalis]